LTVAEFDRRHAERDLSPLWLDAEAVADIRDALKIREAINEEKPDLTAVEELP
jgi:hypothetical protein